MNILSTTIELRIPGIKNEYTFLHVTDTHLTMCSDNDSTEIKTAAYERSEMFRPADGIMSSERFPYFFQYAEDIKADLVFLTGDIVDFPTQANINKMQDSIENSKVNSIYVLGNHDWSFAWDYHSETTKATYIPMYNDICNGYTGYQVKLFNDLQIIAIDNSTNQVTNEQYEITKKQLENGLSTILIMHVPIYLDTLRDDTIKVWQSPIVMGPGGVNPNEVTCKFYDMIRNESNNIHAIITGHLHFDHIDEFLPERKQIITKNGNDGYCRIIKIKEI